MDDYRKKSIGLPHKLGQGLIWHNWFPGCSPTMEKRFDPQIGKNLQNIILEIC